MNATTTTQAAAALHAVITRWPDLHAAMATPTTLTWPPAGLAAYLNGLDQLDEADVDALREARAADKADRSGEDLGDRPVPIRLRIHDVMRRVEASLLQIADQTASDIQRPAAARIRSASARDATGLQLSTLTLADVTDRRRWSWTDTTRRTAPHACAWLAGRLQDRPGPFRPLPDPLRERIERAAVAASGAVEAALEMSRRSKSVREPCPRCGGTLRVHGGDGRPPTVTCAGCSRTWTDTTAPAA